MIGIKAQAAAVTGEPRSAEGTKILAILLAAMTVGPDALKIRARLGYSTPYIRQVLEKMKACGMVNGRGTKVLISEEVFDKKLGQVALTLHVLQIQGLVERVKT